MKRCWSSTPHSRSPNATPALPWLTHSVCGAKIEKTFSAWGMASPCRTRRRIGPLGMLQVIVERFQRRLGSRREPVGQLPAGVARPAQQIPGLLQIVPVRLLDCFLPRLALRCVLGGGVPELLHAAVAPLELLEVRGALPPTGQAVRPGQFGANPKGLADGFVGWRVGWPTHDAVVIGVQPQPQNPQHEDRPLRPAGTPRVRAGLAFRPRPLGEGFPEDGKDTLAPCRVGVEVLEPPQQLRDLGSRTLSAMSVWPNIIWASMTLRRGFRVATIGRG
jgi:hypothetical protein